MGQIGAPEPPPAGIAAFRNTFPIQTGRSSFLPAAGPTPHPHGMRVADSWPVTISASLGGSFRPPVQTAHAPESYSPAPASLDLAPSVGMPRFSVGAAAVHKLPHHSDCLQSPMPQPAERWLALCTAQAMPAAIPFHQPGIDCLLVTGAVNRQSETFTPPPPAEPLPAPEAQPAESWIAISKAQDEIAAVIPFQQPRIGALPVRATFIPAVSTFAALPEPDSVEREARAVPSRHPAAYHRPLGMLRFGLHAIDEVASQPSGVVHGPPPAGARPGLRPMPVESMPTVPAHVPAAMPAATAPMLPTMRAIVAQVLPQARAVEGLAAMPVESMPMARALPVELPASPATRLPNIACLEPTDDTGDLLASHVPAAGPAPVESMPAIAAFEAKPAAIRPAVLTQTFRPQLQARFDIPLVAGPQPIVAVPPAAAPQPAVLDPVARIAAQPAGAQPERPVPEVPTPGPFALEYYCQRISSVPTKNIEWREPRIQLLLQPFALPPAPVGYQDLLKKQSRLVLPFEEIFKKQAQGDEKRGRMKINTWGKIAAAVMVGVALWTGSRIANLSQHTEDFRAQVAASERTVAVAESTAPDPTQGNFGNGPVGKFRRAVANRAATEITDTFKAGMAAWGAGKQEYAPGWKHNAKGYVSTGAMALFQPSLKYTDYRMEFYGQIEEKSIGWVVRAQDKQNYYAMKFTVIEAGLRPIIAMTHYSVVNGKPGRKSETPLSVMVHNNRPIQVAVDVRGNHFSASIDGERIESWSDEASAQGGVGFFSEPGERARLYWMKLSRNQDMLGRFCAYLSGGSRAKQTAEITAPGFPYDRPGPAGPQLPALALLAAGPFHIRRNRRSEGWIY